MPRRTETWGSDLEFYLVTLGYAVGFGCIWRFPYQLYDNGGGVFLIPYTICLFTFCIPQTYLEFSLGQYWKLPVQEMYLKYSRKWRGTAIASFCICMAFSIYYVVIMCYCIIYIFTAFSDPLPWHEDGSDAKGLLHRTSDYFYRDVINRVDVENGDQGSFNWKIFLSMTASWVLIWLCLKNGISSTGKIALFTVIAPYFLLFVMLGKVATLDGSWRGIKYLFEPDFSKLFSLKIWANAMTQAFFQYSVGIGGQIVFASFRPTKKKVYKSAFLICIINGLTSILGSLVVFGYLGYYIEVNNLTFEELPIKGLDQIFVSYPAILSSLEAPNFWIAFFFTTTVFIGIDSQFAVVEVAAYFVEDLRLKIKTKDGKIIRFKGVMVRTIVCFVLYILGQVMCFQGGLYIFETFDDYSFSVSASVCNLLNTILFMKVTSPDNLFDSLNKVNGEKKSKCTEFMLKKVCLFVYITTTLVNVTDIYTRVVYEHAIWLNVLGHLIGFNGIVAIIYYHVKYRKDKTIKNPYVLDLKMIIKLEAEEEAKKKKANNKKPLANENIENNPNNQNNDIANNENQISNPIKPSKQDYEMKEIDLKQNAKITLNIDKKKTFEMQEESNNFDFNKVGDKIRVNNNEFISEQKPDNSGHTLLKAGEKFEFEDDVQNNIEPQEFIYPKQEKFQE